MGTTAIIIPTPTCMMGVGGGGGGGTSNNAVLLTILGHGHSGMVS